MTPAELRKRLERLEAAAPAEPAPDPEWVARVEAMSIEELDAELERRLAEYGASPEGQLFARRIEALTDEQLEAFMKWHCAPPGNRGEWIWPEN